MKLSLLLFLSLTACAQIEGLDQYHECGDACADAAEEDSEGGVEAGTDSKVEDTTPPQPYVSLCCQMQYTLEDCNLSQTWECSVFDGSPFTYPCYTPLCSVGEYCVGIAGPGKVIECLVTL